MEKVKYLFVIVSFLLVVGCATRKLTVCEGEDKFISGSQKGVPNWITEEDPDHIYGGSDMYATEVPAREDAERNARLRAVIYFKSAAKASFKKIVGEFGLRGGVFDPSKAAKGAAEWFSAGVLKMAKIDNWYLVKCKSKATGATYWKIYARLKLPDKEAIESFGEYISRKKEEWKITKEQFDKVNEAFEDFWKAKKKEAELKGK